uniref:RNA-directed DNA polymerase, eukaryota n=1 Tax=Tanacetum cinerariifolium TaxID=118510 RepID=A0A6L2NAB5_TANCI|nr:RNA-directed DNA polymerase, eukaryota [Tanacetum cinerariifolium]GEW25399.1 RNA-directed DNA polymerase, eukaryota [Tanacetum cinerariifolium]
MGTVAEYQKKEKEEIIKKKADAIISLRSELASPDIKRSLDSDKDIGVDEVSSVIDGVFDSGKSLIVFLKWVQISRSRPLLLMVSLENTDVAMGKELKAILEGVFYVAWWYIWSFRNRSIFDEKAPNRSELFDDIVLIIIEYLLKISKKARILELKQRHFKGYFSDILYAISIKEDTAYLCLHFTKDHEGNKIRWTTPTLLWKSTSGSKKKKLIDVDIFMSYAWRRLFQIRASLVHEYVLEFFSTCKIDGEMGLDVADTLCFHLGEDGSKCLLDRDLFCGRFSSYTPFLHTYRGSYAKGLTVIVQELHVIDMDELVRLQLCIKLDDTWAWVASGTERQLDATAGVLETAEDAPIVDEGDLAVPAPVQAPQLPPPAGKKSQTMA